MGIKNLASILGIIAVSAVVACTEKPPAVSFKTDVVPVLQANCMECHKTGGQGQVASGLSMETYESLMKGTKYGPVIKAGDSLSSTLVRLIEGKADPSINMPHGDRQPLNEAQIATIKNWIQQGAQNN